MMKLFELLNVLARLYYYVNQNCVCVYMYMYVILRLNYISSFFRAEQKLLHLLLQNTLY